jgi:hypothetical protein
MVPENIQGPTSTLIPENFPEEAFSEKPFMWRTQGLLSPTSGEDRSRTLPQGVYPFIFQILFLSETDSGLFSCGSVVLGFSQVSQYPCISLQTA